MKVSYGRVCKIAVSFLTLVGTCILSPATLAQESQTIPWEEQPLILNKAIEDYVNGKKDNTSKIINIGKKIRIAYLGFSKDEIEKNAAAFPDVPGLEFSHFPYGRDEYYSAPINIYEYQLSDRIIVLNLDLSREGDENWTKSFDVDDLDLTEVLDPSGGFVHNLALAVYFNMKVADADGTVAELGAPMDDFKNAEFTLRKKIFADHCTSVTEFVEFEDNRPQYNVSFVYTDASPSSKEQIECLIMQALIFTRPESVPFRRELTQN
jgi:hypothetical protein